MDSTGSVPVSSGAATAAMLQRVPETRQAGYGLPCAECKTYYAADLPACPICKSPERVSPTAIPVPAAVQSADPTPDSDQLEAERERFLLQLKSQVYAAHTQINAAASFRCSVETSHESGYAPAAVCKSCYDTAQQRADLAEAALHMDLKEAAQIIYDAVWSDPSDPTKTYQNAAQALLSELRKRAGINTILGPNQPLTH